MAWPRQDLPLVAQTCPAMNPLPRVSVIVPHFNALDALGECLDSLARQSFPSDRAEVIVCDNNSPIDRAAIVSRIGDRARLLFEKEKGAGPARNRAVTEASGEVLAFIDADCVADPAWLARGVVALERGDIVGGRVRVFSRDKALSGADAFETIFAFNQKRYIEQLGFTGSGNMFCHKDTFAAVGPFRTAVSEDIEWCRRATAMGYRLIYAPQSVVGHPSRHDWHSLREKWRRLTHEHYHLRRGTALGRAWWVLRQAVVATSIVPHAFRVLLAEGLTWRERMAALGTLARIRLWRAGYGFKVAWSGAGQRQDDRDTVPS